MCEDVNASCHSALDLKDADMTQKRRRTGTRDDRYRLHHTLSTTITLWPH